MTKTSSAGALEEAVEELRQVPRDPRGLGRHDLAIDGIWNLGFDSRILNSELHGDDQQRARMNAAARLVPPCTGSPST